MGDDYRECSFCVMDTSDPEISFDEHQRCNHCREFERLLGRAWFPNEEGARRLDGILARIRAEGRGREFDCLLGLSGGVDSSYLALKAFEWGLRPLVVHVDTGWNSELSVQNVERIVKHTGFELHTHVVNWETMRDLQLSYLRAGIANQDVPQDHAIFAGLYHFAEKSRVRFVLSGGNYATEAILPRAWLGFAMDARNLRAINRRFGNGSLEGFPTIGFFKYYIENPLIRRMTPVRPLNYMPYSQTAAVAYLESEVGWRNYPRKHGESLFTRFFQNYYLPTRFGYDKRRPHLSTLIAAGSIGRDEAARLLAEPLYDKAELARDREYICRKLRIGQEELEAFMEAPVHQYSEFANWDRWHSVLKRTQRLAERISGRSVTVYSS